MGTPSLPTMPAAPPPPDQVKSQLSALAFAETERKIRQGAGRRGSFITPNQTPTILGGAGAAPGRPSRGGLLSPATVLGA